LNAVEEVEIQCGTETIRSVIFVFFTTLKSTEA